ncbi:hypothetical protein IFM89_018416 [Coptis chinensis]|uniref:Glutaredoxin domain-containing protein n=1 Tax=Coptis chinensis TaxID=261450 RepID=A0A835H6X9_9MAGN|nr:hypothetical protein IFM89_018416 [Coptis chinensis]
MGCAGSKEAKEERCKHCNTPYSYSNRGSSSPVHRHSHRSETQSQRLSDSHTVVSPSSATSGTSRSFKNYFREGRKKSKEKKKSSNGDRSNKTSPEKNQRKTKTPTRTPTDSGEAEPINTWEMKEGLEDISPLHHRANPSIDNSEFSFHVVPEPIPVNKFTATIQEDETDPTKPMWLQTVANDHSNPNSRSILYDFDPEVISTFRKALEELSPKNALLLRSPGSARFPSPGHNRLFSKESIDSKEFNNEIAIPKSIPSAKNKNKVVLYFTSLRGVRKTYKDCCNARAILKGLGVRVDERDVSMHYAYREELRLLLGTEGLLGRLPRVFVKEKYIGTADDVRRMHEDGKLEKLIKGCEMVEEGGTGVCQMCGDVRFIPCEMCSGSCKIYIEGNHEEEVQGESEENEFGGFQRCPYCNENGIVKCTSCCS